MRVSAAAQGLPGELRSMEARLTAVEAKAVTPEAARSLYERSARGIVARQKLTVNGLTLGSPATTDFTVTFTADATRQYLVCFYSQALTSTVGTTVVGQDWLFNLIEDGTTQLGRLDRKVFIGSVNDTLGAGPSTQFVRGECLYEPAAGTRTLRIDQLRSAGEGNLQMQASPTVPRAFWVVDIGLRPA